MIKSHKDLALVLKGKKILHLNSLGKDSVACLEYLANYAQPKEIISVNFEFLAKHPADDIYWKYLKQRYKNVRFVKSISPLEFNRIVMRVFQSPIDSIGYINEEFDFYDIDWKLQAQQLKEKYECDYICIGHSRYESVSRATKFHKEGIVQGDCVYPIGMLSKADIISILKQTGVKLHPCYKFHESTLDTPSYYKMRASFIANPKYYKEMLKVYPLLALDKYRYEKLLKTKKK